MNPPLAFAIALLSVAASLAIGKESPQEEWRFLDGLRARGYAPYALQYLQKLQGDPNLDPDLKASLPLEIAKTQMVLAQDSPLERRIALYAQARAEMEKYLAAHQGRPEAVRANLEVARLAALQGKAQLSSALRREGAERDRETLKARRLFETAVAPLANAVKALDAQMAKYKGATRDEDKQALETLEQTKLQVEFDQALNLLLQAQTYVLSAEDADAVKQGKLAEQAEAKLRELAKRDENNPLCYKAHAWLIPCALTTNEPQKALDEYENIKKIKLDADTLDGKLLADYFRLCLISLPQAKQKNPAKQVRSEGKTWLRNKALAKFGRSPDGYGVWIELGPNRYCFVPSSPEDVRRAVQLTVARACVEWAGSIRKKQRADAHMLYAEAQKLLTALQETENDLTPVARRLNLEVFVAMHGGKVDPRKLKTFQDFYLLARYETGQFYRAQKDTERKEHLRSVAAALRLALEHAGPRLSRAEVLRAGADLADVYLALREPYRAAVLGDHLARAYPPSKETARAAGFALQAYLDVLHRDERLLAEYRDRDDPVLTRDVLRRNVRADREQFEDMARFVEQEPQWQDDNVAQYARYQRALLALQDKDYPQAVQLLEALKPSYPGFGVARCQLALACLHLSEDGATRPGHDRLLGFDVHWQADVEGGERAAYLRQALAALSNLPPLTPQAGAYHFRLYFATRLKQCGLLYRDKKYAELEKFAAKLLQEFNAAAPAPGKELADDVKNNLRLGIETWGQYAKLGQADLEYAKGDYDKVLAMTGPKVEEIKQKVKANAPGSIKDFALSRDLLELALRADVQKGNRAGARKILDLLQRIAGDPNLTGGPTGIKPTEILVRLVLQLKAQVQDLRAKGKPAEAALAKTVESFSAFLDELTRDLDKLTRDLDALSEAKDKKSLKPRVLSLLARSYASLDKHRQAAELLSRVTPPVPQGKKPAPPEEMRDYLEAQLLYAQELRKDGQLDQAQHVLKKMGLKPGGKQTLDMLFLAFDAEKERIRLFEDNQKYGLAYNEWKKFVKNPRLKGLLQDLNFRSILKRYKDENDRKKYAERLQRMYEDLLKLYFDALYHKTYCLYRYGQTMRKPRIIRMAADAIINMEGSAQGWKYVEQPCQELLKSEPLLRQEYDALKNRTK
jgi:hypothetical protein